MSNLNVNSHKTKDSSKTHQKKSWCLIYKKMLKFLSYSVWGNQWNRVGTGMPALTGFTSRSQLGVEMETTVVTT